LVSEEMGAEGAGNLEIYAWLLPSTTDCQGRCPNANSQSARPESHLNEFPRMLLLLFTC